MLNGAGAYDGALYDYPATSRFVFDSHAEYFTKNHAIQCFFVYRQLMLPERLKDHVSFIFNLLLVRPLKLPTALSTRRIR